MSSEKVCVLVAGSWGTALASVLARNGKDVRLWSKDENQVREINETRINSRFLPGIELPAGITATSSIAEAVLEAKMIIIAAPSAAVREVAANIRHYVHPHALVVHATKGFEEGSLKRMSEVISEELPLYNRNKIVVISGPSHAEEVVRGFPTTVVAAATEQTAAERVQNEMINSTFRVYTNHDLIGVEMGGALKNIIAIGGGLSDGLGFGDNAKAALLTRGLAEITRLGIAMGANPLTFSGLAGIGDLVVTCNSKHSRNWRAGYMLAQGNTLTEVLNEMGMVVEGVKTTRSAKSLAEKYNVEMPITEQLYRVLFFNKEPKAAVEDLMGRGKTTESEIKMLDSLSSSETNRHS